MSLFSKNLRFLRKKGNHNQEEISILFNKRANTIGNWENDKSEPSLTELMKLGEYFNVSVHEFLHADLEGGSAIPGMAVTGAFTSGLAVKNRESPDPVFSAANEAGSNAFWLILRELRAVHEKVDLLISGLESTAAKKNSDKSYH
jgi:transcriptional regulator with XRE-family HTH domain